MPPHAAPRVVEQRRRRVPARRRERIAEGGPARRRPAREGEARLERVEGRRAGREERLAPQNHEGPPLGRDERGDGRRRGHVGHVVQRAAQPPPPGDEQRLGVADGRDVERQVTKEAVHQDAEARFVGPLPRLIISYYLKYHIRVCIRRIRTYATVCVWQGPECEDIANGGGAEQYHAEEKYGEAVAEAVEKCADDTAGQTCYICLGDGSEEGLVRGCSCRGASGFVHVSCLVRQAKILVAEAEENNLDYEAKDARWGRWSTCSLCEQDYHGVVACALGWACWKTYLGLPETDRPRRSALIKLGNGLSEAGHHEGALSVKQAELAMNRRIGASEGIILVVQSNLANTYEMLGRLDEALRLRRDVYSGSLRLQLQGGGLSDVDLHRCAYNLASTLIKLQHFDEARSLLRKTLPLVQRVLGESHELTLTMRWRHALLISKDASAASSDLREAMNTWEDTARIARRVLGSSHPTTKAIEVGL